MSTLLHPDVHRQLTDLAVPHTEMECEPELADTAAFCAHYGVDPADSANTILVASKRPPGEFVVCIVLATTRLDANRAVRDAMEWKKLSFAPAETTLEVTGMEIGGVTPFGLVHPVPTLIDAAVMSRPEIVLGGGNRTSKVRLAPDGLLRLPTARVVEDLAVPA